MVRLWPLLAVAGLLIVPVECLRVGHPHSLYQTIPAAGADGAAETHLGHAAAEPHSAHEHAAASHGIPAWASPLEYIEPAVTTAPSLEIAAASVAPTPTPPAQAEETTDLPTLKPMVPLAEMVLGTPLAAIAALVLVLLPAGRRTAMTGLARLRPFVSLLEPPPPRTCAVLT